MKHTIAYMNYGRWLHNCPECKTPLPVDRNLCPVCYPNAVATLMQEVKPKHFRKVPDVELRGQARAQAEARGDLYEPVFPKERQQIERVLRTRKRPNMNWEPGESLDLLIADNIKHGDPLPKEFDHGL